MPATLLTPVSTPGRVRRAGAWCLAGGLLGAVLGYALTQLDDHGRSRR